MCCHVAPFRAIIDELTGHDWQHPDRRGEHYVIAFNDSGQARDLQLNLDHTSLQNCIAFTGQIGSTAVVQASGSQLNLTVPAKQAVVFQAQ